VDAVYIPLPTGLRKEWVLRAAAAGKHVLCEKPCGLSLAEVREMTDACRENRVQFMDGVMFMHNPRMRRLRELAGRRQNHRPSQAHHVCFQFRRRRIFFGRQHPRARPRWSRPAAWETWAGIAFALRFGR
jgi:predicted dehydrogenase